ncbi:MAG: domain containing protein, partial [Chthoniobacteraceae bacterium]|nr:domain containing protein [Chthoniobacteraceae bacterium]
FHLHKDCKISFGSVECEFVLESHQVDPHSLAEIVPTRADLEFLRRENLDLQSKLATQQKQIDILSSARLITTQTTQLGVAPEAHRRIVAQRDELRTENQSLKRDVENLKADLVAISRDRDAMRQAWETVKNEIGASRAEIAALSGINEPPAAAPPAAAPVAEPPSKLFAEAPAALDALKSALNQLTAEPGNTAAREASLRAIAALNRSTMPTQGHPVQRLSAAIFTLLREIAPTDGPLEASAIRSLVQAADLIGTLLEPAHLNKLKQLGDPQVLAIERDADLLATMGAALEFCDIGTTGISKPEEALGLLNSKRFNLILLDIGAGESEAINFREHIHALPGGANTPLVFLSNGGGANPITPANLRGGHDVLEKPLNIVEFTLKAHTWIYRDQLGLM